MADRLEVEGHSGRKAQTRHADSLIAELAAEQENVFALRQLLSRGVSHDAIRRRRRSGQLKVIYRGVYALAGSPLSRRAWFRAATLTHPEAALSYRSAAAFWQMRNSWNERIEVTIPGARPQRPGLIIHHERLAPDEVTVEDGIPVTTPARTLFDLASVLSPFDLERALHESEFREHTSPTSIPALLARHPRRRGAPALRAALGSLAGGVSVTRSDLERDFLRFVYERGLPRPQTNVRLPVGDGFIEVDALWLPQHLVAELDGRASHERAKTFESDRIRDRHLSVLGFQVLRITARALRTDPDAVERDLRALLFR